MGILKGLFRQLRPPPRRAQLDKSRVQPEKSAAGPTPPPSLTLIIAALV